MKKMSRVTILQAVLFATLLGIFLYFRLQPILHETVPYTFDQGRDFLKAQELVRDKNFTLIGPTTGADGVFHGAWWYYFLAIPYILSNGHPSAFYIFIALTGLIQAVLFYAFLKKEFGSDIALTFFAIVALSGYFIKTSIFAINSVLTMPFVLLMLASMYYLLTSSKEKTKDIFAFLLTLSVGFILEAEVAFGLLLGPSIFLTYLFTKKLGVFFASKKRFLLAFFGLLIPLAPRILFEVRNNFFQTKSLLDFASSEPTHITTVPGVIQERYQLFKNYFVSIFPLNKEIVATFILVVAAAALVIGYRKLKKSNKLYVMQVGLLLFLLYLASMINKDNFFWDYYYEGIQYIMLMVVLLSLVALKKVRSNLARIAAYGVVSIVIVLAAPRVYSGLTNPSTPPPEGLRMHTVIVDKLYEEVGQGDWCLQIYTPPVLVHTYQYILDYNSRIRDATYPYDTFINNQCWYVIEGDQYAERAEAWVEERIPEDAMMIREERISESVTMQLWEIPE